MNKLKLYIILISLFAISISYSATYGHGDNPPEYTGYSNWQERSMLVLTNACRINPTGYRDKLIGNYNILLPNNYPAVTPIYWNLSLNRSARYHALDMANNNCWGHNSCDSTLWSTRIKAYYTESYTIGENIAAGYSSPQATLKQWIMDGNPPARDLSDTAGHRTSIMSSNYNVIGCGYGYDGSSSYDHYWVQDFGGSTSPYNYHPIVSGSHIFLNSGKTTFMVNYYNTTNSNPLSASVVIENTTYPLSLYLGTSAKGTWTFEALSANSCRQYYYEFTDHNDSTWRYPENGVLRTYGEGGCNTDYLPPESLETITEILEDKTDKNAIVKMVKYGNQWNFSFSNSTTKPLFTEVINIQGIRIKKAFWSNSKGHSTITISNLNNLSQGIYFFVHTFSDGRKMVNQSVIIR